MALVDELALFILKTTYEDLSENARVQTLIGYIESSSLEECLQETPHCIQSQYH